MTLSKNLIRFSIKLNIGIIIFLGIQIARHHIPSNLDTRSNVDSLISNVTLMSSGIQATAREQTLSSKFMDAHKNQ